jgi:hypothetical protein
MLITPLHPPPEAALALQNWDAARTCTDLTASPGASLATMSTETSPAPPAVAQQLPVDSSVRPRRSASCTAMSVIQ